MKIIYNNLIPFKGYKAINLFGILFVRKGCVINNIDINHETIHTAQMRELLYIFFYLWYIIEFIILFFINFSKTWGEKYRKISFENEAYSNQNDLEYLNKRKHYSWIKYYE